MSTRSGGCGAPGPVRAEAREAGVSLVELLVALTILALLASLAVSGSLESLRRERVRGAAHEIRTTMATARVEAQRRNRACRFAIDATSGAYQVIDTLGTSTTTDDVVLSAHELPRLVAVEAPDTTTPVTLQSAGGSVFYAEFEQSGTVTGSGEIALSCTDAYARVTLTSGGGLRVQWWNDGAWRDD